VKNYQWVCLTYVKAMIFGVAENYPSQRELRAGLTAQKLNPMPPPAKQNHRLLAQE
jgi:hypothetical protein